MVTYRQATFAEVVPIWREKLWPNRVSPIEPTSAMLFGGGHDPSISEKFAPIFFVAESEGVIVGVASGHQTSLTDFRIRGVYVADEFRRQGVMSHFIKLLCEEAVSLQCTRCWSAPRQNAELVYIKMGFQQSSEFMTEGFEFGPNCYVEKTLNLK